MSTLGRKRTFSRSLKFAKLVGHQRGHLLRESGDGLGLESGWVRPVGMLVRPAKRHDKELLRELWGSMATRRGVRVKRRAMVAERSDEQVGSLLINNEQEVPMDSLSRAPRKGLRQAYSVPGDVAGTRGSHQNGRHRFTEDSRLRRI